jgi:sulfhydrogenase subunit beta (sulfur reductase)
MKFAVISKTDWVQGVEKLGSSHRLYGPVKDRDFHSFKHLAAGEMPDPACLNTRLSPKAIIYPQSQALFEYTLDKREPDHHILKELPPDNTPKIVLGIRPCDAKALVLVKQNFDTEHHQDPYWTQSYDSAVFVGVACEQPCSSCFCTTAGCGPYHEAGLDLLLADTGESYTAKVLSAKGADLLAAAGWTRPVDADTANKTFASLKQSAEDKVRSHIKTDRLRGLNTLDLYDAPFWDETAFACINCGTCTYACPTCWCFDIQDENCGASGRRMRNWDSCMSPLFTLHGTGHNPRGTKTHRVRQRFMHKMKYFLDKYDRGIQCVGCGRCIRLCPVNIDIRNVCNMMNRYDAAALGTPVSD